MRYGAAVARRLGNFGQDRSGSFAVMMAAVMAVLALSAGYAVNIAQLYNVRGEIKQALDAAVTSTARDITTGRIPAEDAHDWIERFLMANGDPTSTGGDRLVLDRLTIDRARSTIEVAAHVDVGIYFPLFGLSDTRRVTNVSAAVYSDKEIEVAMMLDVTGSMEKKGKKDKIGDLRTAARNAVNALLDGQNPEAPRVRVSLVPYASGVNVGGLAKNVYAEGASASNLPPVAGSKLIKDKTGKNTLPPFSSYQTIVANAFSRPDTCATERKDKNGNADFTASGPDTVRTDKNGKQYYALVNRDDRMSGKGMNACPEAKVIPLTADAETLLDSIDEYKANGYTAGAIGIQWAYYMLSPEWRTAVKGAGLGGGPAPHDSKKLSKVAILMTDGEFNTSFVGGDKVNEQEGKARSAAESLCDNMKSDGIEIFTIGFDLGTGETAAKKVLKNCATKDTSGVKHYHEASTGQDLDDAFQAIVRNMERVALTH